MVTFIIVKENFQLKESLLKENCFIVYESVENREDGVFFSLDIDENNAY